MVIIKKGLYCLPSLHPLYGLHKQCSKIDGWPVKIYWFVLEERMKKKIIEYDYLAYYDNKLVGSLHIHLFTENVELTAMVLPSYRRRGIFKKLLSKALVTLAQQRIVDTFILCNDKNLTAKTKIESIDGRFFHSISEWRAPDLILRKNNMPNVTVKEAKHNDVNVINLINYACFENQLFVQPQTLSIYSSIKRNNKIYLAMNDDAEIIGKLHIREDEHELVLHGVGILPKHQGNGYGHSFILNWFDYYKCFNSGKPIIAEVLNHNKVAISFYKALGFIKTQNYSLYQLSLNDYYKMLIYT